MPKLSNYSLEQPRYQVGEMIFVVERMFAKKELAEVVGYNKLGDIVYLVYTDMETGRHNSIPVMFEDTYTSKAGVNGDLLWKRNG